jgi:hypothetical protein
MGGTMSVSMKLLAHLRHSGWFDLAAAYPDRGPLNEADWYHALFRIGSGGAGVIVSANAEGLRLVVGSGFSAVFVPWSEATVSGKRSWVNTAIRLATRAVPSVPLVVYIDDAEADAVLRPAGVVLPARRWRRGPTLWTAAAVGLLMALLGVALVWGRR